MKKRLVLLFAVFMIGTASAFAQSSSNTLEMKVTDGVSKVFSVVIEGVASVGQSIASGLQSLGIGEYGNEATQSVQAVSQNTQAK